MRKELKRSKVTLLLLIGLLASFLTACEKRLQTITVTELVTPPDALLSPCDKPEIPDLKTNDDLIKFTSLTLLKWEQCAAKVDALRVFFGLDKKESNVLDDAPVGEPH
jgi:hypothetical protein